MKRKFFNIPTRYNYFNTAIFKTEIIAISWDEQK